MAFSVADPELTFFLAKFSLKLHENEEIPRSANDFPFVFADPILPDILRRIDNQTLVAASTPADSSTLQMSEISDSINQGGRYGYLVAAKGLTQFVCNPFVGLIVSR